MARADRRDRVVGVLGAGVAGLLVGVLGTFKHQVGVSAATGTGWPVGLALSLAMVAALLVALRLSYPSRAPVSAAGVGVIVAVSILSLPGPSGGDQVVLLNYAGLGWLAGVIVVAAAAIGWPRLGTAQRADGILDDGSGPAETRTTRSAL